MRKEAALIEREAGPEAGPAIARAWLARNCSADACERRQAEDHPLYHVACRYLELLNWVESFGPALSAAFTLDETDLRSLQVVRSTRDSHLSLKHGRHS